MAEKLKLSELSGRDWRIFPLVAIVSGEEVIAGNRVILVA